MEDDLKILKVEYLRNHYVDYTQTGFLKFATEEVSVLSEEFSFLENIIQDKSF